MFGFWIFYISIAFAFSIVAIIMAAADAQNARDMTEMAKDYDWQGERLVRAAEYRASVRNWVKLAAAVWVWPLLLPVVTYIGARRLVGLLREGWK